MASVNKVILLGAVGKAPEIHSFQNGGRIASFSLATSERWKDKTTGEKKERTEWHRIAVTNDALINIVERYVTKGSKLYIEGTLQTREYTDKEGNKKYSTDIVVKPFNGEIVLLDSKKEDISEPATSYQTQAQSYDDLGDDIPF